MSLVFVVGRAAAHRPRRDRRNATRTPAPSSSGLGLDVDREVDANAEADETRWPTSTPSVGEEVEDGETVTLTVGPGRLTSPCPT